MQKLENTEFDYYKFYNRLAEQYDEEKHVYRTPSGILRREFIRKLLKRYASFPFLDVGCGGGIYLEIMYNDVSMKDEDYLFGCDIAHPALQRAQKKAPKAALFGAMAQDINCVKSESMSTILCSEVIEHIEESDKLFDGFIRILKNDGILILTCPNFKGKRPMTESIIEIPDIDLETTDYLHTAYKPEEIKQFAENAGFEIIGHGTFEKEIRYWYGIVKKVTRIFPLVFGNNTGRKVARSLLLFTFYVLRYTGILYIISKIANEGARTYIIAKKNEKFKNHARRNDR